jgi:hypothetical protein
MSVLDDLRISVLVRCAGQGQIHIRKIAQVSATVFSDTYGQHRDEIETLDDLLPIIYNVCVQAPAASKLNPRQRRALSSVTRLRFPMLHIRFGWRRFLESILVQFSVCFNIEGRLCTTNVGSRIVSVPRCGQSCGRCRSSTATSCSIVRRSAVTFVGSMVDGLGQIPLP